MLGTRGVFIPHTPSDSWIHVGTMFKGAAMGDEIFLPGGVGGLSLSNCLSCKTI